ncbi:hypothetical protein DYY67_2149 [Candidatus Nitrosotalea sp. TS]|nr:hypothetical protein [Candidatus Nitrosotalea sp. TS]
MHQKLVLPQILQKKLEKYLKLGSKSASEADFRMSKIIQCN